MALSKPGYHQIGFPDRGVVFNVPRRYIRIERTLLQGGEASVAIFHNINNHRNYVIKKRIDPFSRNISARHTHREFVISQVTNHENVIKLLDAFTPNTNEANFTEVYMVFDHIPIPLGWLIMHKNDINVHGQVLMDGDRVSHIIYQILCGLRHLNKIDVAHRDLTISNVMVKNDWTVVIIDLGNARHVSQDIDHITGRVTQEPFRAPEVMVDMFYRDTFKKLDVWAVGCILGWILLGGPLFPATNQLELYRQVILTLGSPPQSFIDRVPGHFQDFVRQHVGVARPWEVFFPDNVFQQTPQGSDRTPDRAREFLSGVLVIDPEDRMTIEGAIGHRYLNWNDDIDTNPISRYDDSLEKFITNPDGWRAVIYGEIDQYERSHVPDANIPQINCPTCIQHQCQCPVCQAPHMMTLNQAQLP